MIAQALLYGIAAAICVGATVWFAAWVIRQ